MERPEIKGMNAIACIFDPVVALPVIGSVAATMIPGLVLSCNVIAVVGAFGVG